jgi:hypothetical protein
MAMAERADPGGFGPFDVVQKAMTTNTYKSYSDATHGA